MMEERGWKEKGECKEDNHPPRRMSCCSGRRKGRRGGRIDGAR
jgi:hypothetical protein